jgi:hypothetical protein
MYQQNDISFTATPLPSVIDIKVRLVNSVIDGGTVVYVLRRKHFLNMKPNLDRALLAHNPVHVNALETRCVRRSQSILQQINAFWD